MSFGYQVLGFGSSAASRELVLDVTSNANEVDVLTLATAAGYNAGTDTTPIVLNIASGVSVFNSSGTGAPALTTGALNAASPLTINVASGATVRGQVGATGSTGSTGRPGGTGGTGGTGGDAIKFEISSGTGTYVVNNEGTVSGGGGGGGGGGGAGAAGRTYTPNYDKYGNLANCGGPSVAGSDGSAGSAGSAGGVGQNGSAGSAGTSGTYVYPNCAGPPSGNFPSWATGAGGPGGPGGTAGKAVNKGGLTVTTGGGGTYNGATS